MARVEFTRVVSITSRAQPPCAVGVALSPGGTQELPRIWRSAIALEAHRLLREDSRQYADLRPFSKVLGARGLIREMRIGVAGSPWGEEPPREDATGEGTESVTDGPDVPC